MLKSLQPSVQLAGRGVFLIALVLMVVLCISIVRARPKGSLVAGILLAIYSAGILLNTILLGPIAHVLTLRAIIFLLSTVMLNILAITGIFKLNRKKSTEQSVPGYDPQLVAMQSLLLAAKVYSIAVGRA